MVRSEGSFLWQGNREIRAEDIAYIRTLIQRFPRLARSELATRCANIWGGSRRRVRPRKRHYVAATPRRPDGRGERQAHGMSLRPAQNEPQDHHLGATQPLHFLLKAEARTLSLPKVLAMTDLDAFALFRRMRWGDGEEVMCPHCGTIHRHYFRPARLIWRCAVCGDDFSVTSGTVFAHHKLPLRLYLAAAMLYTNAVKGISALQMARDLGVQHKTAYVLLHKLRESLHPMDDQPLQGEVHMDGAYVGGIVRPENRKRGPGGPPAGPEPVTRQALRRGDARVPCRQR